MGCLRDRFVQAAVKPAALEGVRTTARRIWQGGWGSCMEKAPAIRMYVCMCIYVCLTNGDETAMKPDMGMRGGGQAGREGGHMF